MHHLLLPCSCSLVACAFSVCGCNDAVTAQGTKCRSCDFVHVASRFQGQESHVCSSHHTAVPVCGRTCSACVRQNLQFFPQTVVSIAPSKGRDSLVWSRIIMYRCIGQIQYGQLQQLLLPLTAGGIAVWNKVASRLLHVLAYLFERLPLRSAGMAALKPAGSTSK